MEYYSERFELQKNTGQTKKARSVHVDPHVPRLGLDWSTDAAKSKLEYLIALGARIGTVQSGLDSKSEADVCRVRRLLLAVV